MAALNGSNRSADLKPPCKQGDFDCLCGLYALLNATRLAHPLLPQVTLRTLFARGIEWLQQEQLLAETVTGGMPLNTLMRLHKATIQPRLPHVRLYRPFLRQRPGSPDEFWHRLQAWQSQPCGIIIEITGRRWNHWSVLHEVKATRIFLFDSSSLRSMYRKNCAIRQDTPLPHIITPQSVLITAAGRQRFSIASRAT